MTCQPTKANMGTVHVAIGGDTRLHVPFTELAKKFCPRLRDLATAESRNLVQTFLANSVQGPRTN